MKQTHSLYWFKENFQCKQLDENTFCCFGTCNAYDYSFKSDTEDNAWLLAEAYLKKCGYLFDERDNTINALKDEIDRNKKQFEKHMIEVGQRHRSKLMSVYFMLDAVSKTGTHREKQTIIMYQKCVLEDMINKGDGMPFETDQLPF